MSHAHYVGTDRELIGHSALVMLHAGYFLVQVDDLSHTWSHGWHLSCMMDWEIDR